MLLPLRALALAGDLGWVPSTHIRRLKTTCNSSYIQAHAVHIHATTHTDTECKNYE